MKALWVVFVTVFVAELGDKTQLATLLFSTEQNLNKVGVFAAASLALVLSTLLAVILGTQLGHWVAPQKLKVVAGVGFVAIGIWTLIDAK